MKSKQWRTQSMPCLRNNQKFLTYPKLGPKGTEWETYQVLEEAKTFYWIQIGEKKIKVSKSSGRELCSNNCNRYVVNLGRYHNEDKDIGGLNSNIVS